MTKHFCLYHILLLILTCHEYCQGRCTLPDLSHSNFGSYMSTFDLLDVARITKETHVFNKIYIQQNIIRHIVPYIGYQCSTPWTTLILTFGIRSIIVIDNCIPFKEHLYPCVKRWTLSTGTYYVVTTRELSRALQSTYQQDVITYRTELGYSWCLYTEYNITVCIE